MSEKNEKKPQINSNIGAWLAIGAGIGTAIGAATDNIGVWVGLGAGIGMAIGMAMGAMTEDDDGEAEDAPPSPKKPKTLSNKEYTRRFIAAIVVYAVLLFCAVLIVNRYSDEWWRYFVIVLPVFPVTYGVFVVVQRMRAMDELERLIQLEALGFAFGVSAVLTFTYGFLETVGLPHINWTWIFPIMIATWGLGNWVASRRYR